MEKKCCICERKLNSYGNNAYPIKEGMCCDNCNIRNGFNRCLHCFEN